ncbi:MAG TPA: hypothetical protein VLN48_17275 [Bryobacteraceae bacterium]|nr:hypothetical protein [Bryobacteraceae bacterium]
MRPAVVLGLISLLAGDGFGQRPGMPLGHPLPPVGPLPSLAGSARPPIAPQSPQRGMRSSGFYSLPYAAPYAAPYYPASYYPGPYGDSAPPAPGVTIIQQFAPPAAPALAPEPPVTPHIQEYPAAAAAVRSDSEPALFAIVLKDGSVLPAAAVMTQENALQIVDADGQHRRVPLNAIDREATRRRNAERNLKLQLPPPSAP